MESVSILVGQGGKKGKVRDAARHGEVKGSQGSEEGIKKEEADQLRVSGEMVFRPFLCFHQVRQEAFSRRAPLAISFLRRVMLRHERQTSSSRQS